MLAVWISLICAGTLFSMLVKTIKYPSWSGIFQAVAFQRFILTPRYPEGLSDYDIITVTESVTYKDGSTGYHTYCNHVPGKNKIYNFFDS